MLHAGQDAAAQGASAAYTAARAVLAAATRSDPPLRLDALPLVDAASFREVTDDFTGAAILGVVAEVGQTHLLDNLPLIIGAPAADRRVS